MPLYEVAILQKPTKKELEDGGREKIIMPPRPVVSVDEQSAAIAAVMDGELPADFDRSRMEVLVRPFAA